MILEELGWEKSSNDTRTGTYPQVKLLHDLHRLLSAQIGSAYLFEPVDVYIVLLFHRFELGIGHLHTYDNVEVK